MATKSHKNLKKPEVTELGEGTEMEIEVFDAKGDSIAKVSKSARIKEEE